VKTDVLSIYSPRELLVHWCLDYKKHCRVLPGTYCKVQDNPLPSNTMVPPTHKGIALGLMGNLQGTVKFYCLNTGCMQKRRSFTPLPMPNRVIQQVNTLGSKRNKDAASGSSTDGRNLTNGPTRYLKMISNFKGLYAQLTQTSAPIYQEWSTHPKKMITPP
jgi:hypothetical protein